MIYIEGITVKVHEILMTFLRCLSVLTFGLN